MDNDHVEKLEKALLDIASMAGGGQSAINNWSKRHAALLVDVRTKYRRPLGILQYYAEVAVPMSIDKQEEFRRELAAVLNRYSMENNSNTPDFLLADYLIEALRALDKAILGRSKWYGQRGPQGSAPSADAQDAGAVTAKADPHQSSLG
jgi:hypothetical protein